MKVVLPGARIREICLRKTIQFDEDSGRANKLYEYCTKIVTEEGEEVVCRDTIAEEDLRNLEYFMSCLPNENTDINEITIDVYILGGDLIHCRAYSYTVHTKKGKEYKVNFP